MEFQQISVSWQTSVAVPKEGYIPEEKQLLAIYKELLEQRKPSRAEVATELDQSFSRSVCVSKELN